MADSEEARAVTEGERSAANDADLASELAEMIVARSPMVVGWEVDARTDTVRLTLPKGYRCAVGLDHLRRGDTDLVARRVVREIERVSRPAGGEST